MTYYDEIVLMTLRLGRWSAAPKPDRRPRWREIRFFRTR